ncbi:thiamine pyrophosphate-binding protein [Leucobacter sp. 1207-22]|uniref:thiamine pyrophosphate-binding protein n=1 Tax=Leucobacter sp. 1207-22 TaxID=2604456 RepID=UPI004063C50A
MQTTVRRTAGWVVIETLKNYGIDTVFGIPGTHNLEFYRPLTELGIRPVTSRHEQGAGYASDGWSLQTGKPGVVITTSGPGLLNALSAAGTAYCESRPMILLAPGPALGNEFADIGTLHETKDQLSAASAIVEWGRRVKSAEEAVAAVHDAFELFATTRPRPVYIEVPLDVLEEVTEISDEALAARTFAPIPAADPALVTEAARLLANAADPVILAGGGSRAATSEIRALAERLGAPVVTTGNAKGVLDEHHPLSLGANLRLAAARDRARDADVLVVVGSKLGEAELWVDKLDAQGAVIRIDLLESQINKNQEATVGLVGSAQATLAALVAELGEGTPIDSAARTAETLAAVRAEVRELSPENAGLAEAIAAVIPADAIVSTDSSQIAYWGLLNTLKASKPNSTPYMTTYATLGYGLPAALGSRIADPSRPSFVVIGDGALMFSMNEFITVTEQREDVTVIVVDNGGYGEIKQNEIDADIAPIAVDLVQPDWAALAPAFGGAGHRAANAEELDAAVQIALRDGGLQVIHIDQATFDLTGGK